MSTMEQGNKDKVAGQGGAQAGGPSAGATSNTTPLMLAGLPRRPSERGLLQRLPSLQALRDKLVDPPASDARGETNTTETDRTRPPLQALAIPESAEAATSAGVLAGSPSTRLKLPPSAFARLGEGKLGQADAPASSGADPSLSGTTANAAILAVHGTRLRKVSGPDEAAPSPGGGPGILPTPVRLVPGGQSGYIKGYKDMPTLSQIRERINKKADSSDAGTSGSTSRQASMSPPRRVEVTSPGAVAGTSVGPKVDTSDTDEAASAKGGSASAVTSPARPAQADQHPLQNKWTLYYDDPKSTAAQPKAPAKPLSDIDTIRVSLGLAEKSPPVHKPGDSEFEARLLHVGTFSTVEGYARFFNNIKPPSVLTKGANYHLFKNGIKPMYEDPANENGGKWVLVLHVGEDLDPDDDVCGAVVSIKPKMERIQLWIRPRGDDAAGVERVNSIGKRMMKVLDLTESGGITFEFQANRGILPHGNKFISIGSARASPYAPSPLPTPASINGPRPGLPIRQISTGSLTVPSYPTGVSPVGSRDWRSASPASTNSGVSAARQTFQGPMGGVRPKLSPTAKPQTSPVHHNNTVLLSGGVKLGSK